MTSPILSICIPFFKFPVGNLVRELVKQITPTRRAVELILADDASDDPEQIEELKQLSASKKFPIKIAAFASNQGRSNIRRYLTDASTGVYILFLDCDMYPDSDDFVTRYFDLAIEGTYDVVVGGRSYEQVRVVPRSCDLYVYHSGRTECVALDQRVKSPLQYVFTNNMMIRRSLMNKVPFDSGYIGWGYEDTDLAINAERNGATILHIDNSASHLGLIDDDTLINKYRTSTANFVRLVRKFPREAPKFQIFRVASALAEIPLPFRFLSWTSEALARTRLLPRRLRYIGLQTMKVFLYANALRKDLKVSAKGST